MLENLSFLSLCLSPLCVRACVRVCAYVRATYNFILSISHAIVAWQKWLVNMFDAAS